MSDNEVPDTNVFARLDSRSNECAGILFRAPGPVFLLVKRSDTGQWEQPGGHREGEETKEQAAVRECVEEIGSCPEGSRFPARLCETGEIRYLCFLQDTQPFTPTLNSEHTEFVWANPSNLPEPVHPEVARTISLLVGNELDIAKRMASGDLLSPQRYENIWLFDLRITGTGTSYRDTIDEHVYRPPGNFLTQEFVDRCNGLPLIFEHPDKKLIDTQEYRDRAIGTILYPYIDDDEVRGIAKVFDEDGAALMISTHASTSPTVLFRDAGSTQAIEFQDGRTILIEGKPSYLDHLAICKAGVWDKGGAPQGINLSAQSANQTGDVNMAEETKIEEKNEDKAPAWADALAARMDAVCARMDAIENKGGDQEPAAEQRVDSAAEEDKAKSDASEEEKKKEEEAKADAARADSQSKANAELRAEIAAMKERMAIITKPIDATDRDALGAAQSRADSLAQMFGDSVTPPMHGETPISYRKRLAAKFKQHSSQFKDAVIDSLEGPAFDLVEGQIYADAQAAALNPADPVKGRLIPSTHRDPSGRLITKFSGDIDGFLGPFKAPPVSIRFNSNFHKENA